MVSKVSGAFCAMKGPAIVVGLLCLSGSLLLSNANSTDATCSESKTLASVALTKESSPIKIKCPDGSDVFPAVTDKSNNSYCTDSSCAQQAPLDPAFSIQADAAASGAVGGVGVSLQSAKANAKSYTLTMHQSSQNSSTLYFQCRTPGESKARSREEFLKKRVEESQATETKCTIQVAAYGSEAAAAAETEKECNLGGKLSVSLNPKSQSFTFHCAEGSSLQPVNFENAFAGNQCADQKALTEFGLVASLLEGKSAASGTPAPPASTGALPAYTFTVSKFPAENTPVLLCYKCEKTAAVSEHVDETPSECTALIEVSGESATGDGQEDNQDPSELGTSSGAAKHAADTLLIALVTLLFSALAVDASV
ncbi:SRS domain-containing protein [Neospora caninum Liverpool]|uniref:SRS domain-containing protein n=1 Tax=Neospora caninum (strain Liverpool) TaxID=572307 RepID=F0VLB8_NEOCL|nr:SRS domain-containing protein [Neospora caninum Liverpool]CBZ54870.1 SRS domain-containing protein [Neospora caninum Liverpool]CEL69591.1 TPA: SRS domain-containing protein [Neospora caninum Liverpool]|eukprot:XP_003884898.1 SRS domain-containing protein [Neospora caninum Liverpool]